jgi:hypothetical protein
VRAHSVRLTEKSRPVGRSLKTQQRLFTSRSTLLLGESDYRTANGLPSTGQAPPE